MNRRNDYRNKKSICFPFEWCIAYISPQHNMHTLAVLYINTFAKQEREWESEMRPIVCCYDECYRLHTISLIFLYYFLFDFLLYSLVPAPHFHFLLFFFPCTRPSHSNYLHFSTTEGERKNSIEQIFLSRIIGRGSYKIVHVYIYLWFRP